MLKIEKFVRMAIAEAVWREYVNQTQLAGLIT